MRRIVSKELKKKAGKCTGLADEILAGFMEIIDSLESVRPGNPDIPQSLFCLLNLVQQSISKLNEKADILCTQIRCWDTGK